MAQLVCNRRDSQNIYEDNDADYKKMIEASPLKHIDKLLDYTNT